MLLSLHCDLSSPWQRCLMDVPCKNYTSVMASEDPPAIWVSHWRAQVTSWKMLSCHAAYTVNLVLCRGNITCMELILLRNKTFRSWEEKCYVYVYAWCLSWFTETLQQDNKFSGTGKAWLREKTPARLPGVLTALYSTGILRNQQLSELWFPPL